MQITQPYFLLQCFSIQFQKCVTWSPSSLPLHFNTPSSKEIRIFGVPMGTSSFTSFFIKYFLLNDVQHVDILLKLGDVQVAFGFQLIASCNSHRIYTLHTFFHLHKFLYFFYSSLFQIFRHLLGLGSFDSLKGSLACKHACFPIAFSGIRLIPIATIALATYLKNWAHVVSIIIVKFIVNQCPFLLKALTIVDNNTFPF